MAGCFWGSMVGQDEILLQGGPPTSYCIKAVITPISL